MNARPCRIESAWGARPFRLLLCLLIVAVPAATAQEDEATRMSSPPGTVVRWVAPDTESCGAEGRSWKPHDDVCYFPVDLHRTRALAVSRVRGGQRESAIIDIGDYPYEVQHLNVERSYVHLSPEDLERSRRDSSHIGALWGRDNERLFELPLASPLSSSPEARNFGSKRIFNGEPRNPHNGADFTALTGTGVLATADATVAPCGRAFFWRQERLPRPWRRSHQYVHAPE